MSWESWKSEILIGENPYDNYKMIMSWENKNKTSSLAKVLHSITSRMRLWSKCNGFEKIKPVSSLMSWKVLMNSWNKRLGCSIQNAYHNNFCWLSPLDKFFFPSFMKKGHPLSFMFFLDLYSVFSLSVIKVKIIVIFVFHAFESSSC